MRDESNVMDEVRRALGRGSGERITPPAPPPIDDRVARLVGADAKLPELFAHRAGELKMTVTPAPAATVAAELVAFLKPFPIRSVMLSVSPLLERTGIGAALAAAGYAVKRWDRMTLDETYDFDCAVTDVQHAVAETGTVVIRPSAAQGRALSLVPMYHVALVEPQQILPDLVDLFAELGRSDDHSNIIMISGPSKTADIEMNVVTGVHGPNVVRVFVVE